MKLTPQQIAQIKTFISKRGFVYYDLQLEIIDHVASKIEELMTANPGLTLDDAIQITHGEFGVTGFSVFEDGMRNSLQKRYWKLFRTTFLSYLKPVYLPLEAGSVYLIYLLAKRCNSPDIAVDIAWLAAFVLLLIYVLKNYRDLKKYKRMLTMQMGGIVLIVLNLPLQLWMFLPNLVRYVPKTEPVAIITGVFFVFIFITFFTLQEVKKIALESCKELATQYSVTIGRNS